MRRGVVMRERVMAWPRGGIRWQMKGIKSRRRMHSKEVDGAKGTKW